MKIRSPSNVALKVGSYCRYKQYVTLINYCIHQYFITTCSLLTARGISLALITYKYNGNLTSLDKTVETDTAEQNRWPCISKWHLSLLLVLYLCVL